MAAKGSFDIYIRRDGSWSFHATFPIEEKAAALQSAESLDRAPDTDGIRVMQTVDGTQTKRSQEKLIWVSPWLKTGGPKPPPAKMNAEPEVRTAASSESGRSHPDYGDAPPVPGGRAGVSSGKASSAGDSHADAPGGHPTAPDSSFKGQTEPAQQGPKVRKRVEFRPDNPGRIVNKLVLAVGISALISIVAIFGIPILQNALSGFGLSIGQSDARSLGMPASLSIFLVLLVATLGLLFRSSDFGLRVTEERVWEEEGKDTGPALADDGLMDETAPALPASGSKLPPLPGAAPPEPEHVFISETRAEQRFLMVRFMTGAIDAIKGEFPRLDTHTAFGLCLFIAAAADSFAANRSLSDSQRQALIREIIGALQTNAKRAETFCHDYPSYRSTPAYAALMAGGAEAMNSFLSTDRQDRAFQDLLGLMRSWSAQTTA
ncbi:MAG: hypothetical protein ACPGNT_04560 [Rhodospirillales bacterium]